MLTRRLTIREASRAHPIEVVGPGDFVCESGPQIEPLEVLQNPQFTLYCFDRANNAAIFVESDNPGAVDAAPFYYQAQAEHAIGLVSMPLEIFHQVAEQIRPPPRGLIFVHSVGRCGSTLLSKALGAIPAIHSLSEPDDLTQMLTFRDAEEAWLRCLIKSSTRWRCKPREGPPAESVAIKTRSEVLVLAELIGPSFPDAKHLFLYRDGLAWMRTIFRGFPEDREVYDAESNRKMEDGWSRTLPMVEEFRRAEAPMNVVEIRMLGWITCMEAYFKLAEMDIPLGAVRFEDLTANPIPILRQVFAFCGIDAIDWNAMDGVLARDSQAGTIYDREARRKYQREMTDALVQDVHAIVAGRPLLGTPHVVLPGTIVPEPS